MSDMIARGQLAGGRQTKLTSLSVSHLALALTMLLIAGTANGITARGYGSRQAKPFAEVDLKVRAIGLGASYAKVRRRLGKPQLIKRAKELDHTCVPSHRVWTLSYDGLIIELLGSLERDDFQVVSMEVTSAKWLITPGVGIGANEAAARASLGAPAETDAKGDHYVNKGNDGSALLQFQGGRLVRVRWESALC